MGIVFWLLEEVWKIIERSWEKEGDQQHSRKSGLRRRTRDTKLLFWTVMSKFLFANNFLCNTTTKSSVKFKLAVPWEMRGRLDDLFGVKLCRQRTQQESEVPKQAYQRLSQDSNKSLRCPREWKDILNIRKFYKAC